MKLFTRDITKMTNRLLSLNLEKVCGFGIKHAHHMICMINRHNGPKTDIVLSVNYMTTLGYDTNPTFEQLENLVNHVKCILKTDLVTIETVHFGDIELQVIIGSIIHTEREKPKQKLNELVKEEYGFRFKIKPQHASDTDIIKWSLKDGRPYNSYTLYVSNTGYWKTKDGQRVTCVSLNGCGESRWDLNRYSNAIGEGKVIEKFGLTPWEND